MSELITKAADKGDLTQTVYVGPTVNGAVARGTIYTNDLPEIVNKILKWGECKVFKPLFVPITRLPEVQGELVNPNSAMSHLFASAEKAVPKVEAKVKAESAEKAEEA